jgi:hypothetical protein
MSRWRSLVCGAAALDRRYNNKLLLRCNMAIGRGATYTDTAPKASEWTWLRY